MQASPQWLKYFLERVLFPLDNGNRTCIIYLSFIEHALMILSPPQSLEQMEVLAVYDKLLELGKIGRLQLLSGIDEPSNVGPSEIRCPVANRPVRKLAVEEIHQLVKT